MTVLTNLQRGNIQTQTSQVEPDDFTLHNLAAMGELSARDLRGVLYYQTNILFIPTIQYCTVVYPQCVDGAVVDVNKDESGNHEC